jgi:peptide/nickel transport system substrate-binding protein
MSKTFRVTALLAVLSLIITACAPAASTSAPTSAPTQPAATQPPAATQAPQPTAVPPTQVPAEPKILRIRMSGDLTNADPAFHPASMDTAVAETVHQGLVAYKPGTWEVVNVLAESIEASPDGLRIDFKLKPGVQFHGGYGELTAEDVKYSYERFIDPAVEASYKGDWAALDHVEVTGKYEGTIVLKEPFAPLWASTLPVTGGVIVSKKAVEEMGLEKYAIHPIGTGPYEFAEWTPDQKVVLKRFEGYWGEKPEWDEIQLIPIPDDSAAEIALETGEVDFAFIPLNSVERFQANSKFEVKAVPTLDYDGIFLNVQHPKLSDINVRQAIRYAVDVQAIIEGAYDGKYTRQCSLLTSGMLGYWENAPCYERVAKAKEYLQKAGLESLDVTLTLIDREDYRAAAEIIQANLAEAGINVEIITQDDGTYWDGGFGDKGLQERQLTLFDWSSTNPDPYWLTVWFTCDQVLQWNWMYWCNEEFDQLNAQATKEQDPAKRAELYEQIQKIWDAEVPTVWTVHPTSYFANPKGLAPALSPAGNIIPWAFSSK